MTLGWMSIEAGDLEWIMLPSLSSASHALIRDAELEQVKSPITASISAMVVCKGPGQEPYKSTSVDRHALKVAKLLPNCHTSSLNGQ
jgi:hypothetical protein